MFKWPGVPSPLSLQHELADFAELICWQQGRTSATALVQALGRINENDYSSGVPEEEDIPYYVENAYQEIERRVEICKDGYPFAIGDRGDTIYSVPTIDKVKCAIYKYLLLATRLKMDSNRCHAGIDGTVLLEELSSETGREYFGDRAESMVFGTAAGASGFPDKVNDLCRKIREGDGYAGRGDKRGNEIDGKLDIVVWQPFSDGLPGKLIAFGQCKTGTNYKNTLTQLQPDSFCRKWMQSSPAVIPLRMFFVAEALPQGRWYDFASDAGVLFDRCRIVDFSNHIGQEVSARVQAWTAAAAKATELPIL